MKTKVNEANVPISKTDYETDQQLVNTIKKNKDNPLPVDDATYKKMLKTNSGMSDTSSTNRTSSPTTTSGSITKEQMNVDAVIEPQDPETIKYLSNVKDQNTGEISKPFVIGDKKYQMIRGIKPNRDVVMAVMCLDEKGENGHKIHSVDHFEKNIAIPMREMCGGMEQDGHNQDKEKLVDHLNLSDANGFKHFIVNVNTGDVIGKFKSIKEMLSSGVKLGPDEEYMDAKKLKHFRYKDYFKPKMNEADDDETEGTNVNKLKTDVKKLTNLISNKFSVALSKIDKPIEKAEFLSSIAQIIGVPFNKLNTLVSSFKDIAGKQKGEDTETTGALPQVAENKIIKKDALLESLGVKQTIIKVKKNKNEGK